jgi:RNA polymerase sigma-70 factor (ECF subfamily)
MIEKINSPGVRTKGQRIIGIWKVANTFKNPADPVLSLRALFFRESFGKPAVCAKQITGFLFLLPFLPCGRKGQNMKYTYAFVTGRSQVEVPEEWADLLAEMDHEEELHNRRETRRHRSLDDLIYEGLDFAAEGDAEDALMNRENVRELTEALDALTETQRRRLLMHCAGMTYREIAKLEKVTFTKVGRSLEQAKSKIHNFFN